MGSYFVLPFSGYSMYPLIKPGDRLVAKPVHAHSLRVGDIVAIPGPDNGHDMVHRLINVSPDGRGMTKGDAMLKPDHKQVELTMVRGRVEAIIRGRRLIPISSDQGPDIKGLYGKLGQKGISYSFLKLKNKLLFNQLLSRDQSKRHSKERAFILSTLRGKVPPDLTSPDWDALTEMAYREGATGILYMRLKEQGIPDAVLLPFENYQRNTTFMNLIHIRAVERLEEALKGKGIQVMTFKGVCLLDIAYPQFGMRFMDDIDLIVRPEDLEPFMGILRILGYENPGPLSHLFVKDNVTIDLHTHALHTDRIGGRGALFPSGMEPLWASAIPWKSGYQYIKRPDDADHVLLLCLHLLQHSFSRLIWLEDIRRLLDQGDPHFWEKLRNRSILFKQRKSLSYTLYLLRLLFNYEPPQESVLSLLSQNISKAERMLLNIYATGTPLNRLGVLLEYFSITRFRDRIRFGWETLFPKNNVLNQEFGVSSIVERLFFYPGRFFELMSLLIKLMLSIPGAMIRSTRCKRIKNTDE
ncbi:MAG: nucleotidyltransferase family protein [bacterium]